jgi:hypothetical protein
MLLTSEKVTQRINEQYKNIHFNEVVSVTHNIYANHTLTLTVLHS